MLTVLEIGFYLVIAGLLFTTIHKRIEKTGSELGRIQRLRRRQQIFVYALTFIGPVEQFLSSDRLLPFVGGRAGLSERCAVAAVSDRET